MLVHMVSCYTGIMKFSGNETEVPHFSCFMPLEYISLKEHSRSRVLFHIRKEEAVMLKACPWCGRIHDSREDCGRKPMKKYRREENERGRNTRAWKRKAEQIKTDSHYLCENCLSQGVLTWDGLETHHIIKLRERPDLLLDDDNLVCLCEKCHKKADAGTISADFLRQLAKKRNNIPPDTQNF